jgi:hypothetical protein
MSVMKSLSHVAVCSLFAMCISLEAVTLVYNIRVRRSFNISKLVQNKKYKFLLSGVPIYYHRTSHIIDPLLLANVSEKRNIIGSLFNFRYMPSKSWWLEVTTGLEKDSSTFKGTHTFKESQVGIDDIVFTVGHRRFISDKVQFVAYALGGIPATTKLDTEDIFGPLVGSRIYNIGFGLEGSYAFLETLERMVSASLQGRFLHGFKRSWTPILPEGSRIKPGNVTDILLVGQWRERFMMYEAGYDATIFSNQAVLLPVRTIHGSPFVRHSLFATVTRGWLEAFFDKPFILGAGFSYSFTDKFDARTYTAWLTASIVF